MGRTIREFVFSILSNKLLFLLLTSTTGYHLNGDFVFDDSEAILNNADCSLNSSLWTVFKNDFWGTNIRSNLSHKSYRPLTILTFRCNRYYARNQLLPFHFKMVNVLLNAFVVLLIYKFLRLLLTRISVKDVGDHDHLIWRDIPFLSALIFSVHPVHVEAVSGIVGRADVLSTFFFFLCILSYDKAVSKSRGSSDTKGCGSGYLFIAVVLSVLSVLCKETGITSLLMCAIYDIVIINKIDLRCVAKIISTSSRFTCVTHNQTGINEVKKSSRSDGLKCDGLVKRLALLVSCVFLTLFGRFWIMNFEGPTFQMTDNPTAFSDSFFTRLATYNYIYWLNLVLLVWPQWLCFDWSMGCIPLVSSVLDPRVVFVAILWCLLLMFLYVLCSGFTCSKDRRLLTFSLAILVVPFLPASNILMPVGFVIAERVLYIPSLGLCILVAVGFRKIVNCSSKSISQITKLGYSLLVLSMYLQTSHRSLQWTSEDLLFSSAPAVCPLNAKVHYNVARVAGDGGRFALAESEYRTALRLYPEYYQAMNNLANLLKDGRRYEEAHNLLKKAIQIKEDFPAAWMNLGIVLANLKRPQEAEQAYMEAFKYRRRYADCHFNIGNLYLEQRDSEKALKSWLETININPHHEKAWNNILTLLYSTNQTERGMELGHKALSIDPASSKLHFCLANLLTKVGDMDRAEKHFKLAIHYAVTPEYLHYTNLGVLYHRTKRYESAVKMYREALNINPNLTEVRNNMIKLESMIRA